MDTREKSFIATLDAAQEYLSLQQQLGEILRTGFLHLASARYAMGADRVSLLQIPATMTATARVQGGDELTIIKSRGFSEEDSTAAAPDGSAKNSDKGEEVQEEPEEDIIAQLGAKFGCSFERNPVIEMNSALAPPVDPIEWFGALVSPNLRKSQEDFVAALQLITKLANVRKQILDNIAVFEQAQ